VPEKPATPKQLRYLKNLATRSGQTFTYPKTAADASREIKRLQTATPSTRTERYLERKDIADQIATGPVHDGARVQDHEISGRGSTATWTQNRDQEPPADQSNATAEPAAPIVGARTELGRYRTPEGERIVYGQRVDGVVRVTDRPSEAPGRCYLVERGLETNTELQALVTDYVAQAARLGRVPMSLAPLEAELEAAA
jgi:hypothetical protein